MNKSEPFQINLTASCNFGCECDVNDVQPVCGANGLTYFSPCHAGCTDVGSNSDNFTNCACKFFFKGNTAQGEEMRHYFRLDELPKI